MLVIEENLILILASAENYEFSQTVMKVTDRSNGLVLPSLAFQILRISYSEVHVSRKRVFLELMYPRMDGSREIMNLEGFIPHLEAAERRTLASGPAASRTFTRNI